MPLSEIDWTTHDPLAFLESWSAAAAGAIGAQLPAGIAVVRASYPRPRFDAPAAGAPPALTVPARFTDAVGFELVGGGGTGAAVTFVTPDNKADSDAALAFAVRVAAQLGAGTAVVVIDAVPGPASWATHLHSLVGVYPMARRPRGSDAAVLVAAPANGFAAWHFNVAPTSPLPTVAVPLRGAPAPALDLEATCRAARERTSR